jgi:hypothetical protein
MPTRVSCKLRRVSITLTTRRWFRQFLVIYRCLVKGGGTYAPFCVISDTTFMAGI